MSDDTPIDWRLKLMQVLGCFVENEGTWYDHNWHRYGITDREHAAIEAEYDGYREAKGRESTATQRETDR